MISFEPLNGIFRYKKKLYHKISLYFKIDIKNLQQKMLPQCKCNLLYQNWYLEKWSLESKINSNLSWLLNCVIVARLCERLQFFIVLLS